MPPLEISVVVPVFNEEENLPLLAAELQGVLRSLGRPYEAIFVDDGSTDGSLAALCELARQDLGVRIVRLRRNAGQSAALAAGFRAARGGIVVTLDADLQNDPADIPKLLDRLEDFDGCDVVCGVRAGRQDAWLRRASSRIAGGVRNRLTRDPVADAGCTLRVYRAEFLRRIPLFTGMHRFLPTLLKLEGARIAEVPVRHRPRRHGQSKYNIRNRIWRSLADLFAVRWMQRRWIDRRAPEEIDPCHSMPTSSGSPSASSARHSSSAVSSCSGSPPSGKNRASSRAPSGT
ncbi:MAG TPA: glycosyltransferase family 2 protein [Thermoanaerobaculia bacterium]|nr:glycosyltransferase family 2 protein [Thermoanaerobaculia bacterium]